MSDSLAPQGGATQFSVLMVCTGNICRSPLAEQLMRSRLGEAGLYGSTLVASAGLGAVVGSAMEPTAAAISKRLRGRPDDFRARQLRSTIVNDADLLLTMTREQRDDVIHRYPRSLQRTFTITEFAKLLSLINPGVERIETYPPDLDRQTSITLDTDISNLPAVLRSRTQELSRMRSRARLVPGDDVVDPFGQPQEVHEAVAQQISLATSQIVHNFVGWAVDSHESGRQRA